ncbi:hypothetical protein LLG96_07730 [bacterium]|nr:hypothetical protein [bacterium]
MDYIITSSEMTDMTDIIETLELFDEKSGHLLELSLSQEISKSYNASVRWNREQGWTSKFAGPNGESVDAFILTLRLFIQDNEPISLRRMRDLYRKAPIEPVLADQFDDVCTELNTFLDSETHLAIDDDRQLTYRDIFEFFIYGSLAHTNTPQKRDIFKSLHNGEWFSLFQAHFTDVLRSFVLTLSSLRSINDEVLRLLKGTSS